MVKGCSSGAACRGASDRPLRIVRVRRLDCGRGEVKLCLHCIGTLKAGGTPGISWQHLQGQLLVRQAQHCIAWR